MPMPWGSGAAIPLTHQVPAAHRGARAARGRSSAPSWGPRTPGAAAHPGPQANPLRPSGVPRWHPEAGVSQGQGASSPSPPCSAPYSFLTPQQAQVPTPLHWGGT